VQNDPFTTISRLRQGHELPNYDLFKVSLNDHQTVAAQS